MPSKKTGPSKVKKDDRVSQTPRGTTQTNKGGSSGSAASSGSKPQSTSSSGSAKQNVSLPTATQNLKTTTAESILTNAAANAVKQNDTVRTGINMAPPTNGRGFSDGRLSGTSAMTGKNTLSYTDSKGDKHTTTAGGLGSMNPLEALQAAAYMRNAPNQSASELRSTASRMDDNSAGRQKLMDTAGFIRNLSQYDQKLPDEQRNTIVRMKNEWNEAQDYIGKLEQYKAQYAEYGLDTSEIDRAIEQAKAFQRQRHDIADLNRSYSGYTGGASGDRFDKWNLSHEYTDVSSDNAHWADSERADAGNNTFDIDLYKQGGTDRYKWVDPTWELKDSMANEEAYSEQLRRMGNGYGADLYKKEVAETAAKQANPGSWDERVNNMLYSAGNRVGGSLLSFGSLAAQATENTIANSRGRYADLKAQQNEARRRLRNAQASGNEAEIKKWQAEIDRYDVLMYGGEKYEPGTEGTLSESYINRAVADAPGTSKAGHDMLEKSREQLTLAKRGLGGIGQFAMETAGVGLENIPTMALYALNPVAGAAYMAATVLGEKGDEFSEDENGNSVSAQEALLKAAPYAAVETASEAIGDSAILGFINKRGSLGLGGIAARSFLTEGAEEGAAGILDYGLDYWYGNPEVRSYTAGKVLGDAAKEALQGGVIGGIMGGGGAMLAGRIGSSQENLDPEWWKNVDTSPMQNYTDRFMANRIIPGSADYIEMYQYLQDQADRKNAAALGSNYAEEVPVRYDPRTWGQDMNILVDMYREGDITDSEWRQLAYDNGLVSMIEDTAERKMGSGSRVDWVKRTIGDLANIQAEYNSGRTIERSGRYASVRNASNEAMDTAGDVLRNETGKKGGIRKNGKADELISRIRGVPDISDIEKRAAALAENESTEKGADIVSMANGVRKPASLRMEEENSVSEPVDIRRMAKPSNTDETASDGDIIDYEYTDADVPAENNDTRTADDMAEDTYEGMSDEEISDVLNSIYREKIDAGDSAVDETENAADIIRNALPEMDEETEREVMTGVIDYLEQPTEIPWSKTDIEKLAKSAYDEAVRRKESESKETAAVSEQREESAENKTEAEKPGKHVSYSELEAEEAAVVDALFQYAVDNKTVEGLEELGKDKANWAAAQEILRDYGSDTENGEYNYDKQSIAGAMNRLSNLIGITTQKGKIKFEKAIRKTLLDYLDARGKKKQQSNQSPRESLESAIRAAHEGITDEQLAEVMSYVSDDMLASSSVDNIVTMLEPGIKGVMAAQTEEPEQDNRTISEKLADPKYNPLEDETLKGSYLLRAVSKYFGSLSDPMRNVMIDMYERDNDAPMERSDVIDYYRQFVSLVGAYNDLTLSKERGRGDDVTAGAVWEKAFSNNYDNPLFNEKDVRKILREIEKIKKAEVTSVEEEQEERKHLDSKFIRYYDEETNVFQKDENGYLPVVQHPGEEDVTTHDGVIGYSEITRNGYKFRDYDGIVVTNTEKDAVMTMLRSVPELRAEFGTNWSDIKETIGIAKELSKEFSQFVDCEWQDDLDNGMSTFYVRAVVYVSVNENESDRKIRTGEGLYESGRKRPPKVKSIEYSEAKVETEEQESSPKAPKPGPFLEQYDRLAPQFVRRHFNSERTGVKNGIYQAYQEVLYIYDKMLSAGVVKKETVRKKLEDVAKWIEKIQKDEINDPRIQALHWFLRNRGLRLTEEDLRNVADLDKVKAEYRDSKRLKITEADYKRDSSGNKVYYRGGDTSKKGHRTPNVDVYWEELIREFNDIGIVLYYAEAVEKNEEDVVPSILAICDASWAAKDNFVSADTIIGALVEDYISSYEYIEKFGDRYGYRDEDELPFDKVSEEGEKQDKPKQKKKRKQEQKPKQDAAEKQDGPGLVMDDYVRANVSRAEQKRLDESAKALGITVRFADEVNGGESNAQYENGVVTIEKNNPNPTLFLYGHEITHHMEDTAPDAHKRLKNYLKKQSDYRKRLADMRELYRSKGYQVSDEYLENEVIANMTGELINNEDILKRFIKANRKNQTFLQKLFSAFRSLLAKLGGTGRSREVAKACRLIEDAIDASIEKEFKKRGGVRNSVKFDYFPYQTYMFKNERYDGDSPLVAVRGIETEHLERDLESGFFVAPSIAVTRPELVQRNDFGNNLVFFPKHVIDPQENSENTVFQRDAWTSRYPSRSMFINPETGYGFEDTDVALEIMKNNAPRGKSNFEYSIQMAIPTFKTVDEMREYYESLDISWDGKLRELQKDKEADISSLAKSISRGDYFEAQKAEKYIKTLVFANASAELFKSSMESFGYTITASDIEKWESLLDSAKRIKTEYFEAKPFQLIPTYKMNAAVLELNYADEDVIRKLEEMDVKVFLYETEEEKDEAIQKALDVSGVRFSLKTSQFKQWGITDREVTRNPDNTQTGKTITEIVDWVQTQMGVQVTTGQMRGNPKTVRGYYRPTDQAVRTRINNNLPTITHELGHWLDDMTSRKTGGKVGDFSNSLSEEARKELIENTDVVKRYQNEGERVHVSEGFAEFIREFLKSKASAQAKFPTVYKELYNSLDARQMQQLDYLADMVNDYMTSPADLGNAIRRRNDRVDTRTAKKKTEDTAHELYQTWVDTNHAIELLTRETGDRSPYIAATNAAYAAHRAGAIITRNMYSLDGTTLVGPSLKHALEGAGLNMKDGEKAKQEYDDFGVYLVAKHGPERIREGADRIGKGRVTADDRMNDIRFLDKTAAELEEKYPHFKQAAEALYQFQQDFLYEYAVGSGIISKKTADKWQNRWEFYVPFQRYMADGKGTESSASRGFANQVSGIYKFKGSGRDIIHPVDSVIGFVTRMTTVAVMNDVMSQITDSVARNGLEARWMERVQTPEDVVKVSTESFKKKVMKFIDDQMDFDEWEEDDVQEFKDGLMALDEEISKYMQGDPHGNVVSVYKNGKAEFWKVNDKLLLESLTSLQPKTMDGVLAMAATVTRFMTSNITGRNVVWSIMSNMPRDIVTAIVFSKNHNPVEVIGGMFRNYANFIAGEKSNNQFFDEFIAMGGGQVTSWNADINNSSNIQRQMGWLTDYSTTDTNIVQKGKNKATNAVMGFFGALDTISAAIESGPRFAEYEALRKQGVSPQDAFYAAMDVTTNFARHGKMSHGLNYLVPFFNASVQGIDKFSRWIRATDIEGTKADRQKASVGRMIAMTGISALAAAMIYGFNNRDDENKKYYQMLSNYTKNNFFCFSIGDGRFFTIPKPREIAVLESFFESAMEYAHGGNSDAFNEFYDYASDQFIPPAVSPALKADLNGFLSDFGMLGALSAINGNRDFLGNPIESRSFDSSDTPINERMNSKTSVMAKFIADIIAASDLIPDKAKENASPLKIDYFLKQVLGGFWKTPANVFPIGDEYKEENKAAFIASGLSRALTGNYVKDSLYSNDLVNWMYDYKTEQSRKGNADAGDFDAEFNAKLAERYTDFYGRFYGLTKNASNSDEVRQLRKSVLDTMIQFKKQAENDMFPAYIEELRQVAKDQPDKTTGDLLPSVFEKEIKDANGEKHLLTGAQYYEIQTRYNSYYAEGVQTILANSELSAAEKAAGIDRMKDDISARVKREVLEMMGAPTSAVKTSDSGKESTTYIDKFAEYYESGKITSGEMAGLRMTVSAQKSNYLPDGKAQDLSESYHKAKAIADYGLDLSAEETMELMKSFGIKSEEVLQNYKNGMLDEIVKNLDDGCAMAWDNYNKSNGG